MKRFILWLLRAIPAVILIQTLFFKFSGAEESVYIFSTLGVEPWGRYFAGVSELIAAALLLYPKYNWMGAALGAGIMLGALGAHLTVLGIEVMQDGGYLFILGTVVLLTCGIILWLEQSKMKAFINTHAQS